MGFVTLPPPFRLSIRKPKGNSKTQSTTKSILHPDLETIPRVPQVQLIGNGTVTDHEGLATAALKHPPHTRTHTISQNPRLRGG